MDDLGKSAINSTTVKVGGLNIVLKVEGDWALVPASLKLPNGAPRFHLAFPREFGERDQGAKYLVLHEAKAGYEPPTRNLLERTLRSGDLFIDVGAHWGFFTLQAATHPAGNVSVIAFEPDPTNAGILLRNVTNQGLSKTVSVVCTACGSNAELAPLVTNSSMGHSIHGTNLKQADQLKGPAHWVSVITLDSALVRFPQLSNRRVVLKVDAEGLDPQVMEGARALLQSGRVALIIWECGQAFLHEPDRSAMWRMVKLLSELGFHHLRPVFHEIDSPTCSFSTEQKYHGNVFSYHPETLPDFDKLLAIKPDDLPALNERGLLLHQKRRFEDALSVYRHALTIKPDVPEVLYNCGNAMLELKQFGEALENYDKALTIKSDYVIALNNRGLVLQQLRRLDEALASYDKVLDIEPNNVIALNNRGLVLQQLQRLDEALASYDKALAVDPKYLTATTNRAHLLQEFQRARPDSNVAVRDKDKPKERATARKKAVTGRAGIPRSKRK